MALMPIFCGRADILRGGEGRMCRVFGKLSSLTRKLGHEKSIVEAQLCGKGNVSKTFDRSLPQLHMGREKEGDNGRPGKRSNELVAMLLSY
jgi:hypothetical protein